MRLTAPAQSEPTRRPRKRRRAARESPILIAPPALPSVRRPSSAPRACGCSRRAERADAPFEPSLLLLLTSPRQLNQSQHDDRESAAEPRASRRSWSRRRLHRGCVDLHPRLARAAASAAPSAPKLPSSPACCCSSCHRASSIRANTTTARAPPSRERVADPDRAAGFAEGASTFTRASRVRPHPPRRARRRSPRAQLAAAPHVTAPAQSEPTRRPRERRRAASESPILIAPPASPRVRRHSSAPRACGRIRRAERAGAPLEPSLLLLLMSPRQLNQSQHDDCESAAEPRASRRS